MVTKKTSGDRARHIRISEPLWRKIQRIAKAKGCTAAAWIRGTLIDYFKKGGDKS